ncbi:MAG TPA: sugar ABC transporter permease [Anaeromyxobacteraceae bacterium]|nr:sugar ABC transporter permease [Anaeromyxobacteraceae bacterium]
MAGKAGVMTLEQSQRRFARLIALPGMAVLVLLVVGPLVYMVSNSFFLKTLATPLPPRFAWFHNYQALFSDSRFWNALLNSTIIMVIGIPIQSALALAIALLLNRKFPGSRVVVALFLIPVMITPVVAGFEWKIILDNRFGPLNFLLSFVGVSPLAWLAQPALAMASILIMDTWQWTPFVTVVLLAGLASIPKQVYEAASVDGSSDRETLWRVTLPLLRPVFTLVVLLRIIFIFKIFDPVQILTGGGPGVATETLSLLTYIIGFKNFNVGMSATIAVVQLVIITVIAKLFIRLVMNRRQEARP